MPLTRGAVASTGIALSPNGDELSHSTERKTTVSGGTNKNPLSVSLACESIVVGPASKLNTGGVKPIPKSELGRLDWNQALKFQSCAAEVVFRRAVEPPVRVANAVLDIAGDSVDETGLLRMMIPSLGSTCLTVVPGTMEVP